MHRSKIAPFVILTICFVELGASSGEDIWQNIVSKATEIAKVVGVYGAGEPCERTKLLGNYKLDTCKVGKEYEAEVVLECNPVMSISVLGASAGVGVCQVKTWIIGLSLGLIILIPLLIFACICCSCLR